MTERGTVQHGSSEIAYEVIRSRRRKKTLQLTVDGTSGALVRAPVNVPLRDIETFVRKRASWIADRLADVAQEAGPTAIQSGDSLPYLGRQVEVTVAECHSVRQAEVRFEDGVFSVTVPAGLTDDAHQDATRSALVLWYRKQAEARLREAVDRWAAAVGHEPSAVLVRDQKRRWGSCSADGTLRLNWRAVMMEPELLDYIVVHELAHLAVRNHSRAFWSLVRTAMPDAEERRRRLREAGKGLPL